MGSPLLAAQLEGKWDSGNAVPCGDQHMTLSPSLSFAWVVQPLQSSATLSPLLRLGPEMHTSADDCKHSLRSLAWSVPTAQAFRHTSAQVSPDSGWLEGPC